MRKGGKKKHLGKKNIEPIFGEINDGDNMIKTFDIFLEVNEGDEIKKNFDPF